MVSTGISWWGNFTASGPVDFDRTDFQGEKKFATRRSPTVSFQNAGLPPRRTSRTRSFSASYLHQHRRPERRKRAGMRVSLQHDVGCHWGWWSTTGRREPGLGRVV